jgi:aminotransferase
VDALNKIGLSCHKPEGAFYVFPCVKGTGLTAMEFAQRLLKEQKVAVVPGTAFGKDYDDYVRMSYASSYENLKEGGKKDRTFFKKLSLGALSLQYAASGFAPGVNRRGLE